MRISVLIVTYNTGATVLDCLQSVYASQLDVDSELEVIVFDNGSQDDTPALVAKHYPDVKLIQVDANYGFGGGNNRAFARASGDVIALVNPDLQLAPDTLQTLATYVVQHDNVGIVGPRTLDSTGNISQTARADYTVASIAIRYSGLGAVFPRWQHGHAYDSVRTATHPTPVAWVQGSCMVMRREVYALLDGFDEDFFLYVEDADLCARASESGLQVIYHPQAEATHIGGTSTGAFHRIRVRGYHLSPLHYFRKRGRQRAVWMLKLLFTLELFAKSTLRRLRNLARYNTAQAQQAEAEMDVLLEVWRY